MPSMMGAPGWFGALARIVTMSIIFGILYIGAVILLHRGCAPLRDFAGHLREMIPWEMFSKSSLAVGTPYRSDAGLIHTPISTGDGA